MQPNLVGLKVLTKQGFVPFEGVAITAISPTITIKTQEFQLRCTPSHLVFVGGNETKQAVALRAGDVVDTIDGPKTITEVSFNSTAEEVYDLIEVGSGNRYYTNGILSHNCEFLSSDALLIDSGFLLTLQHQAPIREQRDFKFWAPIYPENAYIVTVDPATGSGCDYSVIDVYHFPSLVQVAQLRANDLSSPQLYSRLKWVLKGLENKMCEVYFTIENNGVGEGLIALYEADENPPTEAIFVGDEGKRPGMNTQGRTKLRACIIYKELVEGGHLTLNSEQTIRELKTFVRKAGSYQAQIGATDDCVSAGLLLGRVLNEISAYEEDAFDKMFRVDDNGETYHIADVESRGNVEFT